MSSRSGVATWRTAIHLLLTYLEINRRKEPWRVGPEPPPRRRGNFGSISWSTVNYRVTISGLSRSYSVGDSSVATIRCQYCSNLLFFWRTYEYIALLFRCYVRFSGDKCDKFANDSRYREGPNGDCYVAFPRINTRAVLSWYSARKACLRYGGDLARSRAVIDVTSSSWLGHENYSVGLQKNEYVWADSGGTSINLSFI